MSAILVASVVAMLLSWMNWSVGTATSPVTIWGEGTTPATTAKDDTQAVELGVKFQANTNGVISGVRFYKGSGNTGTHTGSLWSSDGQLLARATFSDETDSGWQQVNFSEPVAISANTVYVASYHAPRGRYAIDENFFARSGVNSGPLRALGNGENGGNGVYRYSRRSDGSPTFPNQTWNASNYWVDVVFTPSDDNSNPAEPTPADYPDAESTPTNDPGAEPTPTNTPVDEPTPTNTPETTDPPADPPPSGTTSDPTLVASYDIGNHDVYKYEWVRYQPRQFVSGKQIDPVGNDSVSDPGSYNGWDVLNAPDPPDNGSAGYYGRAYSTNNLISVTLNRPAEVAIVWMAGNEVPSWLSSGWSDGGSVSVNGRNRQVYRRSLGAGEFTLGGMYSGGSGSQLRPGYYILTAEAGGTPSPAPAVPNGQQTPEPNQTCPSWVHDQYVAVGPDGQTYPTWHAQIDPVFWCYFGHEHGSNPAHFDPDYKPLFGYSALTMGMDEPHEGFKVYVGESNGHTFMINQHFGTGGLARACVQHHTFDIAIKNSSGQLLVDLHLMGDFGPALFNRTGAALTPPDCPNQARDAGDSTGVRRLPSRHDYIPYEPWRLGNTGEAVGLRGTFTVNTFDSMVVCNTVTCDQPYNTNSSGTQRALEEFYNVGVRNSPNSGTFYTDPMGHHVVDANADQAVQQFVAPGANVNMGSVVCRDFDGWGLPYTCGSNVGSQPFPPAERENSIVHPN